MTRILDNISGVTADEFRIAVALGQVPRWEAFRKFGMNDDVPATGTEEMWPPGTTRVLPAAAGTLSVVSDSAQDDDTTGTGSWTIMVEGLDANYDPISETITMDGLTPVVSTASFLRVNRAYGVTAGSGEVNAGNISISIGGNLQAYIEATQGQTHQTQYTVPNGYKLVVTAFYVGVGRMAGSTDLHVQSQIKLTGADGHWRAISDVFLWDGAIQQNESSATVIPAKTEIRQVITSTSTTQCWSSWSGYLIKQES